MHAHLCCSLVDTAKELKKQEGVCAQLEQEIEGLEVHAPYSEAKLGLKHGRDSV